MIKKMVDFVFHVYPVGNDPTAGHYTSTMLTEEIKTKYLDKGYEVFGCEIAQISGAGLVMTMLTFAKYEYLEAGN